MTLTEALQSLDPANDSHWTGQGLPMVDIVRELAGDENVTRAAINEVAPDLTRDKFGSTWTADTPPPINPNSLSDVGKLRDEYQALQLAHDRAQAEADKARANRDAVAKQMAEIDAKITALQPNSFAECNRRYQATMIANRMERAKAGDARSDLEKALQIPDRAGRSKINQAKAGK